MRTTSTPSPFWRVWQQHKEHLFQQALRLMGGNVSDAEDAVDTAMLRALQKYASPGKILNERAWLSRILHNICMDIHRERQRRGEAEGRMEDLEPVDPESQDALPDAGLLQREDAEAIRKCIQELPPNLKGPLVMRYLQDMSYADIAAQLRLTHCNVRKRIQLAYGILRTTVPQALHSR
ncbi:sigma-70 family RNA polymerase sigma factor [Corallococcus macrosporus]|uniref:Sigma-70 family RNA polymerase sigma factor n=1 Tax=Corallococcus macrosporus TaxID=35 RepID=A0ABS3DMN6_9BACT|nr:sigma-70 family RNA polymerase sigma factor [Corallococcus macrosporus]